MLDLIAIGDSTLDMFLHIHDASLACTLNKPQCLLCLEYANKIPVEYVVRVPGAGSGSNVAVGASRLKMHAAIVSILGNDRTAEEIYERWKEEGVSEKYVQTDRKQGTNYTAVITFKGERTQLVYHHPRSYKLPALEPTSWIYYTDLGPGHIRLEKAMLKHLMLHPNIRLAFNPGAQQLQRRLAALRPVIARSDVFIVNKEEAEHLLQLTEARPIPNLLMDFARFGAKNVVITDGPNGSYATDGRALWHCPIFPARLVERTGAGDAFTIALINALFRGESTPDAMRAGTANSWSVVQNIGPHAGLLTLDKLQKVLKKYAHIQARKMENNHTT